MSNEVLSLITALMSAIAAFAALGVAALSLRQSNNVAVAARKQTARAIDDSLQSRLDPMYPGLRRVLGHLEDGVPQEIRNVLIPFFVLFSDAFGAHRDGLVDDRDFAGFAQELSYWSQKPAARKAWMAFRQQSWTEGFADYVDTVLAGALAYPDLKEVSDVEPEASWRVDLAEFVKVDPPTGSLGA